MLRILTIVISILLLTLSPTKAAAEEFFDEAVNSNQDLKKKVQEIEDALYSGFADKEKKPDKEIILFIDPDCAFSDDAVKALVQFKKERPDWQVRGVIETDLKDLKQKLIRKGNYFSNDIEFSIDIFSDLAKQFNIYRTPSYVIAYKGRYYKVAGQPDLNEIISKLNE